MSIIWLNLSEFGAKPGGSDDSVVFCIKAESLYCKTDEKTFFYLTFCRRGLANGQLPKMPIGWPQNS